MAATITEGKEKKEGSNLLGSPTFTELDNGRLKCVETGHEVLEKDRDSYSLSKKCRLGLIDFAVSRNKPPLNMFKQDPLDRSKLVCKLTGDTINKTEEHTWKHLNGKRFLNKLEQLESDKVISEPVSEKKPKKASKSNGDAAKKTKKKKKKKDKGIDKIISEVREPSNGDSDSEKDDFWMPPVGERWDFDDGGDRWGSGSDSGDENDDDNEIDDAVEDGGGASDDLSTRTKRMSIEIGPSSFASRKKKSRKNINSEA